MSAVPVGAPLRKLIEMIYLANVPILLEGPHGLGKSAIFEQAAEALGIGVRVLDLSVLDPTDLTGLPYTDSDRRTCYAPPACLPDDGQGLLVFEELNRCLPYVRTPCLQLLTARRLHDYVLPTGWLPCATINPSGGDYQTDELDPALLSRFLRVQVVADVDEWLAWAERQGVHEQVRRFVGMSPNIFNDPGANPRAWTYVGQALTAWEARGDGDQQLLAATLSGLLDDRWAGAFLRMYSGGATPLRPADILQDYPTQRALVQAWVRGRKLDLVHASLDALKRYLQRQAHFDAVADSAQAANAQAFFADLPPDLKTQLRAWLRERGYAALSTVSALEVSR